MLHDAFHFQYKCRDTKNRSVKTQEFEIPGTVPLVVSNQYWDTEKIPKDWKTSATVPALLQGWIG